MDRSLEFPDFYKILGIKSDASLSVIKQRYHQLSLQHHPDKTQEKGEDFVRVNLAYRVLSEPELKHQYDLQYVAHANASVAIHDQVDLQDLEFDGSSHTMACRCGGVFSLPNATAVLPLPMVCISCDTCSLCITVLLNDML